MKPLLTVERALNAPRGIVIHIAATASFVLGGCNIPVDPEGTYDRVHQGPLRVGVCVNPPWTTGPSTDPAGIENQLMSRYAREHGLDVEWSIDTESVLIEALDDGRIDVLIGGFTDDSPWTEDAAATRPYFRREGRGHVLFVRQGENRWLLKLDTFLHANRASIAESVEQAHQP